ncbi:hypothetical protein P3S67_001506 [Capsicum chacoense]
MSCLHGCGTKSEKSNQLRSKLLKHFCRKRLHFLFEDLYGVDSLKDHKEIYHLTTSRPTDTMEMLYSKFKMYKVMKLAP